MTDKYTFRHGPLEVKTTTYKEVDNIITVRLRGETIIYIDDQHQEAAELFKAFKQVYEAGARDA